MAIVLIIVAVIFIYIAYIVIRMFIERSRLVATDKVDDLIINAFIECIDESAEKHGNVVYEYMSNEPVFIGMLTGALLITTRRDAYSTVDTDKRLTNKAFGQVFAMNSKRALEVRWACSDTKHVTFTSGVKLGMTLGRDILNDCGNLDVLRNRLEQCATYNEVA